MDKSHLQSAAEELDAEIRRLSAIRDSLYSLNGSSAPPGTVVWNRDSAPASNGTSHPEPPKKGSGIKNYWANMSPLQRRREMARRMGKRGR